RRCGGGAPAQPRRDAAVLLPPLPAAALDPVRPLCAAHAPVPRQPRLARLPLPRLGPRQRAGGGLGLGRVPHGPARRRRPRRRPGRPLLPVRGRHGLVPPHPRCRPGGRLRGRGGGDPPHRGQPRAGAVVGHVGATPQHAPIRAQALRLAARAGGPGGRGPRPAQRAARPPGASPRPVAGQRGRLDAPARARGCRGRRRGRAVVAVAVGTGAHAPAPRLTLVRDLLRYRALVRNLVLKELTLKYRDSVLGIAWSLGHPALLLLVYTVAFRHVLRVPVPHYPLFLLVTLLPWNFFAAAATPSTGPLVHNGALLRKAAFPREALPVASVLFVFAQLLLA